MTPRPSHSLDGDGVLRAFHNVCRHRGARVAWEEQGCASRLRCRYHGWTYDLTGKLRGTPEFDGTADFRRGVDAAARREEPAFEGD